MEHTQIKRYGPLDGLRAIAVLIVFFSHTAQMKMYLHYSLDFWGIGHTGVYLFFCLSAYLLASKLFEEGVDARAAGRFYIKRFFRIVPLYFTVVVSVFLSQTLLGWVHPKALYISQGNLGFLQHLMFYRGDGVFWSVVIEEQFYILVPLWVFLFIRFRMRAVVVFGAIALVNFLLYISKYLHWPIDMNLMKYVTTNSGDDGNYVDIFIVMIILLYFFKHHRDFFERNKQTLFRVANWSVVVLMSATVMLVSHQFLKLHQPFYGFRYLTMIYTVIFGVFIISVPMGNPINRYLNFAPLRYIGMFGFSIYLLHPAWFEFVRATGWPCYVKFAVSGLGIFGISACTYYVIERPFIRFSYYLIDRFGIRAARPTARPDQRQEPGIIAAPSRQTP